MVCLHVTPVKSYKLPSPSLSWSAPTFMLLARVPFVSRRRRCASGDVAFFLGLCFPGTRTATLRLSGVFAHGVRPKFTAAFEHALRVSLQQSRGRQARAPWTLTRARQGTWIARSRPEPCTVWLHARQEGRLLQWPRSRGWKSRCSTSTTATAPLTNLWRFATWFFPVRHAEQFPH